MGVGKRHDLVDIEQGRRRRAIGHREHVAHDPGLAGDVFLDEVARGAKLGFRLLDTERIALCGGPEPVAYDLLHLHVEIEIEEAIAEPRLRGQRLLVRDQLHGAGKM